MLRENQFQRATELFYEAAAVPELLPAALQVLADASGAWGVNLLPVRPGPPVTITSPSTQGMIDDFLASEWLMTNPRMKRGLQLTLAGWKGLMTERDMFGAEPPKDPWHSEFLPRHDLGSFAGLVLAQVGAELALPISIERRVSDGPFTAAEIGKLNRLLSLFKPAADLALRIGLNAAQRVADSLSAVGRDTALLGNSGRMLHLSPSMERHFGDAFIVRNGYLTSWDPQASSLLAETIERALAYGPVVERVTRPVAVPRRNGRPPLLVRVVPISGAAHDVFMLARAVLIVADPTDARSSTVETIATTLGLSGAEARMALQIASGQRLQDIADIERITIETARSRLKSVFAKTGTHRQVELAVLIANLSRQD